MGHFLIRLVIPLLGTLMAVFSCICSDLLHVKGETLLLRQNAPDLFDRDSKTVILALCTVSFLMAIQGWFVPVSGIDHFCLSSLLDARADINNWAPALLEDLDFVGIQYIFTSLTNDVDKSMQF